MPLTPFRMQLQYNYSNQGMLAQVRYGYVALRLAKRNAHVHRYILGSGSRYLSRDTPE